VSIRLPAFLSSLSKLLGPGPAQTEVTPPSKDARGVDQFDGDTGASRVVRSNPNEAAALANEMLPEPTSASAPHLAALSGPDANKAVYAMGTVEGRQRLLDLNWATPIDRRSDGGDWNVGPWELWWTGGGKMTTLINSSRLLESGNEIAVFVRGNRIALGEANRSNPWCTPDPTVELAAPLAAEVSAWIRRSLG
jgi:hypothetical protein